jgi:hypothetical protein
LTTETTGSRGTSDDINLNKLCRLLSAQREIPVKELTPSDLKKPLPTDTEREDPLESAKPATPHAMNNQTSRKSRKMTATITSAIQHAHGCKSEKIK